MSSEFTVLITDDTAQQKLKPLYITLVVLGPILLAAARVFTILASGIRFSKRATTTSSISSSLPRDGAAATTGIA